MNIFASSNSLMLGKLEKIYLVNIQVDLATYRQTEKS